jgi:diguanylate cyclase (GGDEF)-like protein
MHELEDAERLVNSGHLARAITSLTSLLSQDALADKDRVRAELLMAKAHLDHGEYETGLTHATLGAEVAHRLGDAASEAESLTLQTGLFRSLRLQNKAAESMTQALSMARASGDRRVEALALIGMANLALDAEDEEQARLLLNQALVCARDAANPNEEFWALNNLSHLQGMVAQRLVGGPDPALLRQAVDDLVAIVDQALEVAAGTDNALQRAFALSNLADAYLALGDLPQAETLITAYAALAREHGFARLLAYAHLDEARLLQERGHADQAIDLLTSERHQNSLGQQVDLLMNTERALVTLLKRQGRFEQALQRMEQLLELQHARLTAQADRQARVLIGQLDVEQARTAAENAKLEAAQHALRAHALQQERDQWHRSSHEDALTGVGNRRAADQALAARLLAANAGVIQELQFVAFVDIDHFKQVNDTLGHAFGDRVLQTLGDLIRGFLRQRDSVYRFGGEEFVLLLAGAHPSVGEAACEHLRGIVEQHDWAALSPGLRVTASFGVAQWQGETTAEAWLARADAALYEAKRSGRNRVVPG